MISIWPLLVSLLNVSDSAFVSRPVATAYEGSDESVWVSVRNDMHHDSLKNVILRPVGSTGQQLVGTVEPGQEKVAELRSGRLIVMLYTIRGHANSLLISPQRTEGTRLMYQFVPAVISLAGVLAGAWLLHRFTRSRESIRSQFDWNKMIYERYEAAVRDFLASWGGATISTILDAQFEKLQRSAVLPHRVIKSHENCRKILIDPASPEELRRKACTALYGEVANWILRDSNGDRNNR